MRRCYNYHAIIHAEQNVQRLGFAIQFTGVAFLGDSYAQSCVRLDLMRRVGFRSPGLVISEELDTRRGLT